MTFIRPAHSWIRDIYTGPYILALKVRRMCSEEVWEGYRTMNGLGTEDFTEVILMNKRLAELRKAVASKSRPDFFKREAQRGEVRKIKSKSGKA